LSTITLVSTVGFIKPTHTEFIMRSVLNSLRFTLAALATVALAGSVAAAADYKIDAGHTTVLFKIKHLGVANFYGVFTKSAGTLSYDAATPAKNSLEIIVEAGSVFTADKKRDGHLKGPDFFNVKQFPTITFKSTKVTAKTKADGVYEVAGNLTFHGKTKAVTFDVTKTGEGNDPWGGTRIGFEGKLTISRAAFDVGKTFLPPALSDDVELTISIEVIKQ
jgi:polyisoprenoid-binding protein YceI